MYIYVFIYTYLYECMYVCMYITVHKPSMLKSTCSRRPVSDNCSHLYRYGKPAEQMLLKTRSLILQMKKNSLHLYTQTYGHRYNIKTTFDDRIFWYHGWLVTSNLAISASKMAI